jgi:hypothetical protein
MDIVISLTGPGAVLDLGFGSGVSEEGVSIDVDEDKNTMTKGADGEVMHSLHAGTAAILTLRYLQTSPANQALNLVYNAQRQSAALWGKNIILVRHTASGDLHTARQCAFQKKANVGYKKVGGFYEWPFHVGKLDSELGIF